jgi:uncharacterized protein (DUF1697 family)
MTMYVAMLRGVNVSGRNKLAMEDLRAVVTAAGGSEVRTYIQSGNAVFHSRRSVPALVGALETALERLVGSNVPVLVRTRQELEAVLDTNPFVPRVAEPKALHVTFMGAVPGAAAAASVVDAVRGRGEADDLEVIGREVYLLCPNGYGNTKLTNAFFERRLGSSATTRNWATVTKLVELARC